MLQLLKYAAAATGCSCPLANYDDDVLRTGYIHTYIYKFVIKMEQFFAVHFKYRMSSVAWRMRNANQSVYYVYDSMTHVGILRSGAAGCVSASVCMCMCQANS